MGSYGLTFGRETHSIHFRIYCCCSESPEGILSPEGGSVAADSIAVRVGQGHQLHLSYPGCWVALAVTDPPVGSTPGGHARVRLLP